VDVLASDLMLSLVSPDRYLECFGKHQGIVARVHVGQ
jgi:hypothetical protein